MKRKAYSKKYLIATLLVSLALMSVGCKGASSVEVASAEQDDEKNIQSTTPSLEKEAERIKDAYADYPIYFQEILCDIDEYGSEVTNWDEYLPDREIRADYGEDDDKNQFILYIDDWELPDGNVIKDTVIDLSDYQEGARKWSYSRAFYDEDKDTIYLVGHLMEIYASNNATDEERKEIDALNETDDFLMLVEFAASAPQDYSVTIFSSKERNVGGAWFYNMYRIGNTLYQQSDINDLWEINLETKEMHYCAAPREMFESIIADYDQKFDKKGIAITLYGFCALKKVDDITIYSGNATDRVNWDLYGPLMKIYLAYTGGDLVSAMLIDQETGEIELMNTLD